jgi:hypothetical protein
MSSFRRLVGVSVKYCGLLSGMLVGFVIGAALLTCVAYLFVHIHEAVFPPYPGDDLADVSVSLGLGGILAFGSFLVVSISGFCGFLADRWIRK